MIDTGDIVVIVIIGNAVQAECDGGDDDTIVRPFLFDLDLVLVNATTVTGDVRRKDRTPTLKLTLKMAVDIFVIVEELR